MVVVVVEKGGERRREEKDEVEVVDGGRRGGGGKRRSSHRRSFFSRVEARNPAADPLHRDPENNNDLSSAAMRRDRRIKVVKGLQSVREKNQRISMIHRPW